MKEKRIIIDGKETNYIVREDGTVWSEIRKRVLKGTYARNEYHSVYLIIDGEQKSLLTHRLVAEAFCENPNNYDYVHHKNHNKHDNRAENLEWVDASSHTKLGLNEDTVFPKKVVLDKEEYLKHNWKPVCVNENYIISDNGIVINAKTGRVLKQSDRCGYRRVLLNNVKYSVHRLVYFTFTENSYYDNDTPVDHINGIRSDNRIENLRLISQKENMKNAYSHGHKGQIPIVQIDLEGNIIKEFSSMQEAADAMNVTQAAIRGAVTREGTSGGFRWKKKEEVLNTL